MPSLSRSLFIPSLNTFQVICNGIDYMCANDSLAKLSKVQIVIHNIKFTLFRHVDYTHLYVYVYTVAMWRCRCARLLLLPIDSFRAHKFFVRHLFPTIE